eukprot:XP_001710086.1 Hypothetical protein GL50803_38005 [Giardia lamblia ATCC 50803]
MPILVIQQVMTVREVEPADKRVHHIREESGKHHRRDGHPKVQGVASE